MTEQLLCVTVSTGWLCTPRTVCIIPSHTAKAEGSSGDTLGAVMALGVNGDVSANSL